MNPCEQKLSNDFHSLLAEFRSFQKLMDERDKRYESKFGDSEKAVASALAAQKEMTGGAFVSSEKAIVKAEESQKSYNVSHNDLIRKMDEQNKATMPRLETESRFAAMEEKITTLKASVDIRTGSGSGMQALWGWIMGAVVIVLSAASYLHK